MLFMVIERFKDGNARLVGERFRQSGRMLPEGVAYHASWVDSAVLAVSRSWKHCIQNC